MSLEVQTAYCMHIKLAWLEERFNDESEYFLVLTHASQNYIKCHKQLTC